MIHRDGALKSATYRVPLWVLRGLLIVGIAVAVVLVLASAFYGPILQQAIRVPGLVREVERLTIDNGRVRELARALDSAETRYARLRSMVGADIMPDPVQLGSPFLVAPVIVVVPGDRRPPPAGGPSVPQHWPREERGFVTRGLANAEAGEPHPGLDIAVPVGALVRAAGGGTVLQTGDGVEYGRFVLLQHPNGYQTMYGHLSRITAVEGDRLDAGAVVGRSGNTGRSSAPHLHFEVRLNGIAIDPLTLVKEAP
jgi:hypothetical protein